MKKLILAGVLIGCVLMTRSQAGSKLTLTDKIYGLSRFWSDVNYNFVYLYKVNPAEWNNAYNTAIGEIQNSKTDYEYFRILQKLCAVLKDGHTQIYLPDDLQSQVMVSMFGEYRLFLMNVQGKVLIVQTNKSKEKEIPAGSEVTTVNGMPVAEFEQKNVTPYISASTMQTIQDKAANQLLSGLEGDTYDIGIKLPSGEMKKLYLIHKKTTEQEVSPPFLDALPSFSFRWLKEKVAYVSLNSFEDTSVVNGFVKKLPELRTAKSVIIDLRSNGGGSSINARNIAKYFVEGNLMYGARNYSREIIPTDRAIGSFLEAKDTITGKPEWGISKQDATELYEAYMGSRFHAYDYKPDTVEAVEKIRAPVVVLTSALTASAAEDFLIFVDGQKNIKRVGDFTNGSTGQPIQIALPGNASAWICTKKVTYADGREFVGTGIKPDILVKQNKNDVLYPSRYDSQLERAMDYLNGAK